MRRPFRRCLDETTDSRAYFGRFLRMRTSDVCGISSTKKPLPSPAFRTAMRPYTVGEPSGEDALDSYGLRDATGSRPPARTVAPSLERPAFAVAFRAHPTTQCRSVSVLMCPRNAGRSEHPLDRAVRSAVPKYRPECLRPSFHSQRDRASLFFSRPVTHPLYD